MKRLLSTLVLVLTGVMTLTATGYAQGSGTFTVPWTGVNQADLLDAADIAHISASRIRDFEEVEKRARHECQEAMIRSTRRENAHQTALRSSDFIMSDLQASTFNRFRLEDLTASRRTGMVERFGAMTYTQSMMMHTGLALEHGMMPAAGARSFSSGLEAQPVPYDCQ